MQHPVFHDNAVHPTTGDTGHYIPVHATTSDTGHDNARPVFEAPPPAWAAALLQQQ